MLTMEIEILTQVLRLRDRGLSVFPVSVETKKPAVSWDRYQDQLPTDAEIRNDFAYAEQKFGQCAVGIACGPVSDTILLDFDFKKHPEAKQFYEANRHRIPRTWKEETGSGGWHFYFRWASALDLKQTNTTSKLHLGVDTKGYGGYSKITPSPGYKWLIPPHMAPLAMCPQWLIDALPTKDRREIADAFKSKPDDWMIKELESVDPANPIHGRTPTFCRAIGRLKSKGLNEIEVRSLLSPWAEKYQYPNERLAGLVDDQFRRYPPRPQAPTPESDGLLRNHSLKSFRAGAKKIPFLVEGVIGLNTINIMAGLQESRKSWLMLDLAVSVASGTQWMNKFQCKQGKVLVIDQERPRDEMVRRIDALAAARGLSEDVLEGNLVPKASLEVPFQLNVEESFKVFDSLLNELRPDLVLLDSLSAIQSGDIMVKRDMQLLFERIKLVREKYKTTIVIIHHENKGAYERIREGEPVTAEKIEGSGVINQVPEGIFVVVPYDGDSSFFHHVKYSYGTKIAPFMVKVRDLIPDKSQIAVEAY